MGKITSLFIALVLLLPGLSNLGAQPLENINRISLGDTGVRDEIKVAGTADEVIVTGLTTKWSVKLSWLPGFTNRNGRVVGVRNLIDTYRVVRQVSGNPGSAVVLAELPAPASFTFRDNSSLQPNTTYEYRVLGLAGRTVVASSNLLTADLPRLIGASPVNGGFISSSPIGNFVCVGDGDPDFISVDIQLQRGPNFTWLVTKRSTRDPNQLEFVAFSEDINTFDFDKLPADRYRIFGLSFTDGLRGLEIGNLTGELNGTFEPTNGLTVVAQTCRTKSLTTTTVSNFEEEARTKMAEAAKLTTFGAKSNCDLNIAQPRIFVTNRDRYRFARFRERRGASKIRVFTFTETNVGPGASYVLFTRDGEVLQAVDQFNGIFDLFGLPSATYFIASVELPSGQQPRVGDNVFDYLELPCFNISNALPVVFISSSGSSLGAPTVSAQITPDNFAEEVRTKTAEAAKLTTFGAKANCDLDLAQPRIFVTNRDRYRFARFRERRGASKIRVFTFTETNVGPGASYVLFTRDGEVLQAVDQFNGIFDLFGLPSATYFIAAVELPFGQQPRVGDNVFDYLELSCFNISNALPVVFISSSTSSLSAPTASGQIALDNDQVSIFPNPTNGELEVRLPLDDRSGASLTVFAADGRRVLEQTTESVVTRLDVHQLANGPYQLIVRYPDGSFETSRFIKQ